MLSVMPVFGAAEPTIVRAPVLDVSDVEPVVTIDAGRKQGLSIGDAVALVDGMRVVTAGEVFVVGETQAAVRLLQSPSSALPGCRAVAVTMASVARLKNTMPMGTTVWATVVAVAPAQRQVWIDAGRASGLQEGDNIWIRRGKLPISRGRAVLVLDRTSLVQCRHLVANARPEIGDAAELWPSPAMARNDRPVSIVMEVTPDAEGAVLKLAGAARDGLRPERQFDLFDGDAYVGLAGIVTSSDRLCLARSLRAFCTTQPTVGLQAVSRPPPGRTNARLEARIFDIRPESNYVLISAGHADGVALNQTFAVLQDRQTVARLLVKAVNVDFAGAEPLPADDGQMPRLNRWDVVVREPITPDPARRVGEVSSVFRNGAWLTATLTAAEPVAATGAVLRVNSTPPTAAVVVERTQVHALLYVPPHWGAGRISIGETIDELDE